MRKEELKDLINESFMPSEVEVKEKSIRELRTKLKAARKEALDLREKFDFMKSLGKPVISKIEPFKKKGGKTDAVALLIASDWHVEEIVKPEQVNGLNSYNPEIAKARANNFWRKGLRLIDILSEGVNLDTIVTGLLGDFITNNLHDSSIENNAMLPAEAALFAQDLIASGIYFLLNNCKRKLVFICHSGNHGRMTKRIHHGTENGNSLEYMIYCNLAKLFHDEPRVEFIINEGYQTHLNVLGVETRWHHGHNISYGGGVGGITIPVNKSIAAWDQAHRSDIDFFGHFHQYTDGGKFFCNGSLIGYNSYALSIKASYEPPQQGLHIIDSKRGRTYRCPIYV